MKIGDWMREYKYSMKGNFNLPENVSFWGKSEGWWVDEQTLQQHGRRVLDADDAEPPSAASIIFILFILFILSYFN